MSNRYPHLATQQRPADYRTRPPRYKLPRYGRSNIPRLHVPANMNVPGVVKPGFLAPVIPKYGFARTGLRLFVRLNPWISAALLAYDLYELAKWAQARRPSINGWTSYVNCDLERIGPQSGKWGPNACLVGTPEPSPPWQTGSMWWHHLQKTTPTAINWRTRDRWFYPVDPGANPTILPEAPALPAIPWQEPDLPPWLEPLKPPLRPDYPPIAPPIRLRPPRPVRPEDSDRGPAVKPLPPQPLPRPSRPSKDERERKVKGNYNVRKLLGNILSEMSEAGDFLDALHDALPDKVQAKDGTMFEKFEALFYNLDKVDMNEAFQNLIENQVTDKYYAKLFADMQEVMEGYGLELPSLRL